MIREETAPAIEIVRRAGRRLPLSAKRILKSLAIRRPRPRWGSLRRLKPLSDVYGFDRGTPVDRYFIAQFLGASSSHIGGRVLEVRDPEFSHRFGGERVSAIDLLDIDPSNVEATIVTDLSERDALPEGRFDTFILTQTLQYVRRMDIGLANAWRALSPGGVLLLSVPSLSRIDPIAGHNGDLWRLTPAGLRALLLETCAGGEIEVAGYGNLLASMAFLLGVAAEEMRSEELAIYDPDFPLIACARVRKPDV